jgi:endo-1,3(4)-beta-glucanase
MVSANIFADPIATAAPPSNIGSRRDHPVVRQGVISNGPIGTNKFYANMFLGSQTSPTFLFPYSVAWAKGKGASASWGLVISHIEASQRVFGNTDSTTGAASYYLNPIGIQSMVISAQELNSSTVLTTESPTAYSAKVQLRANAAALPAVEFPLVQGQAFITAIYNGAMPLIQTGVFFRSVTKSAQEAKTGVTKYRFQLQDGTKWLLYSYPTSGTALDLQVVNDGTAKSRGPFYGTIQIAKDPGTAEAVYDNACGAYPTGVELSGTANGATGTYTFTFTKGGMPGFPLLMFALPHQVSSFDSGTRSAMQNGVNLQTTTKGIAVGVMADSWTMVETMPVDISFYPWLPGVGSKAAMSDSTRAYVRTIAQQELSQDILGQTDQSSVYFSGKVRIRRRHFGSVSRY